MIEMQDWLAPLLGSLVLVAVPLIVALMANTVVQRMRSDDLKSHENRLDKRTLPTRKDDERARIKVSEHWDRIDTYVRARNLCFLVALAVVEVNVGLILLALTANSPAFAISILVVLVILFAAAVRFALKKAKRPIWATTPGYYRDIALDTPGNSEEETA